MLLLRLPPVQTFIAKKVVNILSEKTEAKISLDKVAIRFFDNVQLEEIYIEDLEEDTLLYVGKLRVDINLFKLISKEATLDQVLLENAVVNIKQDEQDSTFNFQFLIDAFAPSDTTVTDTSQSQNNWQFSVNAVELNQVRADINLPLSGFSAQGIIGTLSVETDELKLEEQIINLDHIALSNTDIAITLASQNTASNNETDTATTTAAETSYLIPDIGWVISANEIHFENNIFALDDESKPEQENGGFDPAHFKLTDLTLDIENIFFGNHVVKGDINQVAVSDKGGLTLQDLQGDVLIDTTGFDLQQVLIKTANSRIAADLQLLFPNLQALTSLSNKLELHADFKKSTIAGSEVAMFMPQESGKLLRDLGTVSLEGKIDGNISDINGKDFILALNESNKANLNFHAVGLPGIDTTFFELNMDKIVVTPKMITKITGTELPPEVQRLGTVTLKGQYKGTIQDMEFDGSVSTNMGSITADLEAQFNKEYTYASYNGKVNINNFKLGEMLNDTTIGPITLEATVQGSGLSMNDIQADLKATIKEATYRGYTYNDLNIDGTVDGKKFTGYVNIDDPNVKLDFQGLVNMNDTLPEFSFEATIDTVNLGELNLMSDNVGISADIEVDFQGLNLDNFNGHATIKDIHVARDTAHIYMDSVKAVAEVLASGNKRIELISPIINARLTGDYNMADLPRLMVNYVNDYFPVELALDTVDMPPKLAIELGPKRPVADQSFELLITISNPLNILQVFVPQLTELDTAHIQATFDTQKELLQLNALVPRVKYGSMTMDSIAVAIVGSSRSIEVDVRLDTFNYGDKIKLPVELAATLRDEKMAINVKLDSDSLSRLELGGVVKRTPKDLFRFVFNDSLILNGEPWMIPDNNYIDYLPGHLTMENISFRHNDQKLTVSSPSKDAPIDIRFDNFNLYELSDLAEYDSLFVSGITNGVVSIDDTAGNFAITADLDIDSIKANGYSVGNLTLDAGWQGAGINVDMLLKGYGSDLAITGTLAPESGQINMKLDMDQLKLEVVEPFVSDYIEDGSGSISADFDITGELMSPSINGFLAFNDASAKILYANTRYTFPDNNKITVTEGKIDLNRFVLLDQKGRKAVLKGTVTHDNFSNFNMDLSLKTNEFLFMNTSAADNDFFYGKVLMAIDVSVKGEPSLPVIDGSAAALAGTEITVAPIKGEDVVEKADYVVFASPPFTETKKDSVLEQEEYSVDISGVDMNLAFELNPEAALSIEIDPLNGDKLTCKGNANLVIDIDPNRGPQITGTYTVQSGSYSFSYKGLLRREFEVREGSRIIFAGDPLDARLDITAVYSVEATTYELVSSQAASMSTSEVTAAQRRTPVNVLLMAEGQLSDPEISFDIRIPSSGTAVTSMVARKLAQIRQNPTELNKQVFALLLFKSFIAEEGSNTDLASTGQNVALKSVSRLISNQLNKLAGRAKGFEINFDVQSYKTDYETQYGNDMITEVQLDVSKQFLDDRLEVTVGGNLNVQNSTANDNSNAGISNITGDFVIEYKLTENGRYRVKVFQTSDYDLLNQSNLYRTGVGLIFHESFRQLLKKKDKREKQEEPKEETDKSQEN